MGKVYNGIMGLVVADALGVPFEFKKRDTFKAAEMVGYGTYNQPPGTWSDDSSMTLATLESLGRLGRIDTNDIMKNFAYWYFCSDFTPHGKTFDVGNTTRLAIEKYSTGTLPGLCGGSSIMDNGNGSLMRILPLAFIDCKNYEVYKVSALTHAHGISKSACDFYINVAKKLLKGEKKQSAISQSIFKHEGIYEFRLIEYLDKISRDTIRSTGYVVDTLEAALWCLIHTDNYKDCVLAAVNLGDDTDTVAAVAGGLAGILYGVGGKKGIPEEWIEKIARKEWIKELCDKFEETFTIN